MEGYYTVPAIFDTLITLMKFIIYLWEITYKLFNVSPNINGLMMVHDCPSSGIHGVKKQQ